jgi:nucleoside-diphosphate-sugar epimerase
MSELHVVFGTGPIGRYTADTLLQQGHRVRMINRSGVMHDQSADIELIASDAFDRTQNIALTRGATAIYFCVAPAYSEWASKFPPLQQAVLDAAIANQTRLAVTENLYGYGAFRGTLQEDSPSAPTSRKGKVRLAMQHTLQTAHQQGLVQVAQGRASDFFGPYDTNMTNLAIKPALSGKAINLLGRLDQLHTFSYVKDFGRLMATLGTNQSALGQVWFAPSPPAITQATFVQILSQVLDKPVKTMVLSPLLAQILGLFHKNIAEVHEMLYQFTAPFVIDTQKAQTAFGLTPTPIDVAISETVAWCQRHA